MISPIIGVLHLRGYKVYVQYAGQIPHRIQKSPERVFKAWLC